ncbi:MAG: diadenylate cyclase CdaA [Verrucomicrobiales bacterium]|nr:diadenylate cyclase CdaA [Verrucomicrobiales bacterium]
MADFLTQHWRDGVEILILAAIAYQLFLFFRATRGARILTGLLVILLSLTLISRLLDLSVISWLLERFSVFFVVGLVVIFQPELRRLLAELGSQRLFSLNRTEDQTVDDLIDAMRKLSATRCGALFAIKRDIDLTPFAESGVLVDAKLTPELITTIFHPKTTLHDGGVILDKGRIHAASCVFPVSQREVRDRSIGLRHRAGLGITEETDAVALVVSEESGALSICFNSQLKHDLEPEDLRAQLQHVLAFGSFPPEDPPSPASRETSRKS